MVTKGKKSVELLEQDETNCCESASADSGKGLMALLIIVATIANIGASYLFSTQVIEKSQQAEYAKVGGKENYDLLNKIQLEQIKPFLEQYKAKNAGATAPTAAATDTQTPATQQPAAKPAVKADRPTVDLFVMSYCPFGLQAEKAFAPLMDKFKKYADINIRFVQYTMHGLKEGQENTRQYCIREEQPAKLSAYVQCFVKAGDSESCLKEANIDTKKLEACYTPTFEKFGGEAKLGATGNPEFGADKDAALAAGVQGSPTLVINGAQVEANRTQAGYAKAICDAFSDGKKPAICDEKFSEEAYQPGFGVTTGGTGAPAAQCGN